MDSDEEEELAALLEEEAAADVQEEEHLMVLAALAQLLASNEKPRRGGSAPGRVKAKNRHRLQGYCMLYSDYFADAPLHGERTFRRRYRMSRKPKALPQDCEFHPGVRQLLQVQDGLHRQTWIHLDPEVHDSDEDACIRSSR